MLHSPVALAVYLAVLSASLVLGDLLFPGSSARPPFSSLMALVKYLEPFETFPRPLQIHIPAASPHSSPG